MFRNLIGWLGVVENNVDPQKRGRVQVRVMGAHDVFNDPLSNDNAETMWNQSYNPISNVTIGSGVSTSNGGQISFSQNIEDLLTSQAISQGVDVNFVKAVAYIESRGNQSAVSPVGAIGIMQLMPATAKDLGVDPYDPQQNVYGGVKYLKQLLDRYNGDQTLAIMAYNWGMGNVDRYIKTGGNIPEETQNYVNKMIELGGITQNSYQPDNNLPQQERGELTPFTPNNSNTTGHYLPTKDLPWAICLYSPIEYGGTGFSSLPAPQIQKGAWVFGVSLDGEFMNQLLIIGIMPNSINLAKLSTNENNASVDTITGIISNSQRLKRNITNLPYLTNINSPNIYYDIKFDTLVNGVWGAVSNEGKNTEVDNSFRYGDMKISPALAARYLLTGLSEDEISKSGWKLNEETKQTLEYIAYTPRQQDNLTIKGFWGSDILNAQENDPSVADFCNQLQSNSSLNMMIGAAYFRDCLSANLGNGDPVLACLYYDQGANQVRNIFDKLGYKEYNKIPDNMTYYDFVNNVQPYIAGGTDFSNFVDTALKDVGGLSGIEQKRRSI